MKCCTKAIIHPLQTAFSLSKEQCEALHTSIKEVIQHAVQVNADSKEFPVEWLFHFRWGKKPGKVNGKLFPPSIYNFDERRNIGFLQVVEKAVEVDADSSHFPSNWIFHAREKKPGKAFVGYEVLLP